MSDERKECESVIRKIKALLETSGRTEAEIDTCSEKVQELLAKYKLSMSDLSDGTNSAVIRENDFLTDKSEWIVMLVGAVARLYFCGYYYETFPAGWVQQQGLNIDNQTLIAGSHRTAYLRHNFIGRPVDILVAKAMGRYLSKAIEDLCCEEELKWPPRERRSFELSFMNAATARVRHRLLEKRRQAEQSGIVGTTNLPAVQSMYQQAQEAAKEWLEQEGIKLGKAKKALTKMNHQGGAHAGWKAGDKIGLDDQVGDAANNQHRRLK